MRLNLVRTSVMVLAALVWWSPAMAVDMNVIYEENKTACMGAYGPVCGWFGCWGGSGDNPEEIAESAHSQALPIIGAIVESNIEPWWSNWWTWTPPDNSAEYDSLVPLQKMFDTCDLEASPITFPSIDDVSGSDELTVSGRERIETGLANVRMKSWE